MKILRPLLVAAAFLSAITLCAQPGNLQNVKQYLTSKAAEQRLNPPDVENLVVTNSIRSGSSGAHIIYLSQESGGKRIMNSSLTVVVDKNGNVLQAKGRNIQDLKSARSASGPKISLKQAVNKALNRMAPEKMGMNVEVKSQSKNRYEAVIDGDNYHHTTRAELGYWALDEGTLVNAWKFDLDLESSGHWWSVVINGADGHELWRTDWQEECNFQRRQNGAKNRPAPIGLKSGSHNAVDNPVYNVFPFPEESPNFGSRQLVNDPAIEASSPFGWHDTDGSTGAEFTITRGNNVHAYEDEDNDDFPGYSPDGGEELNFDFALNLDDSPDDYLDAAITNLFYTTNYIHDILAVYGFDEDAGNFQQTNYGGSGNENDNLNAEAHDGGGTNNANMATPPDGANPRMQMYLWTEATQSLLTVNSPSTVSGSYVCSPVASFGPGIPDGGITADVATTSDADGQGSSEFDFCDPLDNPENIAGKIALVNRGICLFTEKVSAAEDAGALAVIIVNNVPNGVINMGGNDNSIGIPSIMITQNDGADLFDQIQDGSVVNATLSSDLNGENVNDACFDNGIITHEYVHGLSTRLTGGASNSGCLGNEEQMGEGWSDWYSMMLTMNGESGMPTVKRGIGTFANGEAASGNGIRVAPYDTAFAVNDYTYNDLGNFEISVPHGVGFIWSTMLWDLTWAFIDEYGFDADLVNGQGGNVMALHLVTHALKLQPCSPGFVDGRDAILLADELNNDGANKCLIWRVFARRGLGFSASQGSTDSRTDGQAAYDLPVQCLDAENPPQANFDASQTNTCNGIVQFIDESTSIPQTWLWEFGDGQTSTEQNPTHQYQEPGDYTVTLSVTNNAGEDQIVQDGYITYTIPASPVAMNVEGCAGDSVTLAAAAGEGNILWLNENQEQIGSGEEFEVLLGNANTTYYAQTEQSVAPPSYVGPENGDIGTGGNHATGFVGAIDFETYQPLVIASAYVKSGEIGERTIKLWQGEADSGVPMDEITVDIDFEGWGRINLGYELLEPGQYSMGLSQANLYRNLSGADYPYTQQDLISITGSPAGNEYYYYFYDLEVGKPSCKSNPIAVDAVVSGGADFEYENNQFEVDFTDQSQDASQWLWEFDDGSTSTDQNPDHVYEQAGTYEVTLTVNNNCSITEEVNVAGMSGNVEVDDNEIRIFPNPASNEVTLDLAGYRTPQMRVELFSPAGKMVLDRRLKATGGKVKLNVSGVATGTYILRAFEKNGKPVFKKPLVILD